MTETSDRRRMLRAIRKCLVDGKEYFQKAMDTLDDIGRGSIGVGMTPLVGGYAIKDPKSNFRSALIEIDSAERALEPLITRFKDGRVNESHFKSRDAIVLLGDLAGVDYNIIVRKLAEQTGRESTWYRLKELRAKIEDLLRLIAED
ncbi:MAG: hypothetical protein ACFFCT_00365 [Candidatus Odinarchaeota archaeon]|nr:hypothetical protein [Candidatus Thorarchaeota archaeon]